MLREGQNISNTVLMCAVILRSSWLYMLHEFHVNKIQYDERNGKIQLLVFTVLGLCGKQPEHFWHNMSESHYVTARGPRAG